MLNYSQILVRCKGWPRLLLAILVVAFAGFGQLPPNSQLVAEFGRIKNDELMVHVDRLQTQIVDGKLDGYVVLKGSKLSKLLNQRRIEGCNLMRSYPKNSLKFVFADTQPEVNVQIWAVPREVNPVPFKVTPPDFALDELTSPIELSSSMALDEFCPIRSDIAWFAKFLASNPRAFGKIVIDVKTKLNFCSRVAEYRSGLISNGIDTRRVRFAKRHFHGESDFQFWLMPKRS